MRRGDPAAAADQGIGGLLEEGLLLSDTPKGQVRIGLPMAAVPYLFPGVFPAD